MKIILMVFVLCVSLISLSVNADTINCNNLQIKEFFFEKSKSNIYRLEQSMVVGFTDNCGGKLWAHTAYTDKSLTNKIVSKVLSAMTLRHAVNISVKLGKSSDISHELSEITLANNY